MLLDVALLVISLAGPLAASAETPMAARPEIRLANVRSQLLPSDVAHVHVDPKGRVWYEYTAPGGIIWPYGYDWPVERVKAVIATEFHKPSPQITGCRIELFEPGGRVWFCVEQHSTLLGYDGHQWIEYRLDEDFFAPHYMAASQGFLNSGRSHHYTSSSVWFMCAHGILRFDGKTWIYQHMLDHDRSCWTKDFVWDVSDDGQVAVAHGAGKAALWIFREGKWTCNPRWLQKKDGRVDFIEKLILRDREHVWYCTPNGKLHGLPVSLPEAMPDRAAKLIDDLRSDDFKTREDATQKLYALGPEYQSALNEVLSGAKDPEQKVRLRLILTRWKRKVSDDPRAGLLPVDGVRYLGRDENGRVYILAYRVGEQKQQALVVLSGKNREQVKYYDEFLPECFLRDQPFRMTANGRQLWIALAGRAQLLDLEKNEFVDTVPLLQFTIVEGMGRDGCVFLSESGCCSFRDGFCGVYRSKASEHVPKLAAIEEKISQLEVAVTTDGSVWTNRDGLRRFSNGKWTAIHQAHSTQLFLRGQNNVLFALGDGIASLYQGDRRIAEGDLETIIQQNHRLVGEAFGPHPFPPEYDTTIRAGFVNLLSDANGNTWLWTHEKLRVLVGDRWQDVHGVFPETKQYDKRVRLLPVGDGKKIMLLPKTASNEGMTPLLAEICDGESVLTKRNAGAVDVSSGVRDLNGTLWMGLRGAGGGAVVVTPDTMARCISKTGNPDFLDASGNVWLGPPRATFGWARLQKPSAKSRNSRFGKMVA